MSDPVVQEFRSDSNGKENSCQSSVSLTITLQATGVLDYSFPSNELLSYGLLEKARAKLDEMALVANVKHAPSSRGGMAGLLKRMKG